MEMLSPPDMMNRMITGYWTTQAIYVAAKLGIADLLADGSRSAEDLAEATKTDAPSMYRLLRALASLGIFAEEGMARFTLTPLAECLRSDVPRLATCIGDHERGGTLQCVGPIALQYPNRKNRIR